MANSEHLALLKEGVENWDKWRVENPDIEADLREADLSEAKLTGANLHRAYLRRANLSGSNLHGADLSGANLAGANLTSADLTKANLAGALLLNAQLEKANLSGCFIYGISVWNVNLKGATQSNLRITPSDEPSVEVDDLKVAQFIYLLLNNENIRDVIGTIGKKGVLILGRFTAERNASWTRSATSSATWDSYQ